MSHFSQEQTCVCVCVCVVCVCVMCVVCVCVCVCVCGVCVCVCVCVCGVWRNSCNMQTVLKPQFLCDFESERSRAEILNQGFIM